MKISPNQRSEQTTSTARPDPLAQNRAANYRISSDLRQLFIIDSNVPDYDKIVATIPPGPEVQNLDPMADGLGQISEILHKGDQGVSLHLISHGAPGTLYLGNGTLELNNLETYRSQLEQWDITDLYIYGCNVAAGDAGSEFIEKLQQITGATIYANAHPTGNPELGGTRELTTVGNYGRPKQYFHAEALATYPHLLGATLVKDINAGYGSDPANLTNVNGTLYFTATDGTNGIELWKSYGTDAGTAMVLDINTGAGNAFPTNPFFTNLNGTVYFRATDTTGDIELWKSNGSGNMQLDVWLTKKKWIERFIGLKIFTTFASIILRLTKRNLGYDCHFPRTTLGC